MMNRKIILALAGSLVFLVAACGDEDADGAPAVAAAPEVVEPAASAEAPASVQEEPEPVGEPAEAAEPAPVVQPAEAAEPAPSVDAPSDAATNEPETVADEPEPPAGSEALEILDVPAAELAGVTGWINSEPTTIAELNEQNRVVLIDFWTYTCVNCIRTMPFLREWHQKYGERGLTILGVHAPEFEFEKDPNNVQDAVQRFELAYPIVQDNEMTTWRAFANQFWPAKYLIGANGNLRYRHFGEGAYVETEKHIRAALEDAGWDVSDIPLGTVDEHAVDPNAISVTRELYGGYGRNYTQNGIYARQPEYYEGGDRELFYEDPSPVIHDNQYWYLQGLWRNEREAIVHARVTEDYEDYIALRFIARSVNVVLNPLRDEPFDVVVELAGRPLTTAEFGADVIYDDQGRSIIRVDEPRMYAIVELPGVGEHELKLRSNSDNFAMFAFTFGIYTEGP